MANPIQYSFQRYEKKYFLTPVQRDKVLAAMQPYVKPDTYGHYPICNIYYDTDDWRLIRASIEKPTYKEKLRVRSYGVPTEDSPVFVELKKKCAGVVYKRRISTPVYMVEPFLYGLLPNHNFGQIGREIDWFQKTYQAGPKVLIAYDRLAFSGVDDPALRITFDKNMRWRSTDLDLCHGDYGAPLLSTDEILMEIKLSGVCPLWLSRLLSEAGAFPVSFSKYGTCYEKNLFRPIREDTKKEAYRCA